MNHSLKRGSSRAWGQDTAVFLELTPSLKRQLANRIYQLMLADLRLERERLPQQAVKNRLR